MRISRARPAPKPKGQKSPWDYPNGARVVVVSVTPPSVNPFTPQIGVEVVQEETPCWLCSASSRWVKGVEVGQRGWLQQVPADSEDLHLFIPDAPQGRRVSRTRR